MASYIYLSLTSLLLRLPSFTSPLLRARVKFCWREVGAQQRGARHSGGMSGWDLRSFLGRASRHIFEERPPGAPAIPTPPAEPPAEHDAFRRLHGGPRKGKWGASRLGDGRLSTGSPGLGTRAALLAETRSEAAEAQTSANLKSSASLLASTECYRKDI